MKSNRELYQNLLNGYYNGAETLTDMINAVQPFMNAMPKECFDIFYKNLLDKVNPKLKSKPESKKTRKTVRNERSKKEPSILSDLADAE